MIEESVNFYEGLCKNCNSPLTTKSQKLFCSSSCSAIFNNTGKVKRPPKSCTECGAFFKSKSKLQEVCSRRCMGIRLKRKNLNDYLSGKKPGWVGKTKLTSPWLRAYLKQTRGSMCSKCGWDEKHPIDGVSLTEINHIDGDATNCALANLEILCPNCHSLTFNFRSRNKKSQRVRK